MTRVTPGLQGVMTAGVEGGADGVWREGWAGEARRGGVGFGGLGRTNVGEETTCNILGAEGAGAAGCVDMQGRLYLACVLCWGWRGIGGVGLLGPGAGVLH